MPRLRAAMDRERKKEAAGGAAGAFGSSIAGSGVQPVSIQPDRLRPGWSVEDLFSREAVEASNLPETYRSIPEKADYREKSK